MIRPIRSIRSIRITSISGKRCTRTWATPSSVYNHRHGFPQDHYIAAGFLFNIEYITRDNPNRAYKGIYFDAGVRSGRGYTAQYFKGTRFNDTEAELRFPTMNNQFNSGVVFGSLQSGNDAHGIKLFQQFQPGGGAGFRVLFNKATRTNLALDYAWGRFGNKGFFLNLNESF